MNNTVDPITNARIKDIPSSTVGTDCYYSLIEDKQTVSEVQVLQGILHGLHQLVLSL